MTHDPFQAYTNWGTMLGPYSGVPTLQPFTQQNYGQYPFGLNPLAQLQGISPFHQGQPNPFTLQQIAALQNPLLAAILQNPLQNPVLNPVLNPLLAQPFGGPSPYQPQYQQAGFGPTPFGQTGTPYGQAGYPLAPQSWIGQGAQTGQIHPLYQQMAAARAFTPGIHPWAGY